MSRVAGLRALPKRDLMLALLATAFLVLVASLGVWAYTVMSGDTVLEYAKGYTYGDAYNDNDVVTNVRMQNEIEYGHEVTFAVTGNTRFFVGGNLRGGHEPLRQVTRKQFEAALPAAGGYFTVIYRISADSDALALGVPGSYDMYPAYGRARLFGFVGMAGLMLLTLSMGFVLRALGRSRHRAPDASVPVGPIGVGSAPSPAPPSLYAPTQVPGGHDPVQSTPRSSFQFFLVAAPMMVLMFLDRFTELRSWPLRGVESMWAIFLGLWLWQHRAEMSRRPLDRQ
jgi:hypothetical protein